MLREKLNFSKSLLLTLSPIYTAVRTVPYHHSPTPVETRYRELGVWFPHKSPDELLLQTKNK